MTNLGLKLVSLVVAILIWAQITLTSTHQTSVLLDLKVTSQLPGESTPQSTYKLPLRVSGRGIDIMKLRHSKAFIQMDEESIQSAQLENYKLVNAPENLGLRFMGVDPTALQELQNKMQSPTGLSESDNLTTLNIESGIYIVNVPLTSSPDIAYFPSTITFKVRTGKTTTASLKTGITVIVDDSPSANGLFTVIPKASAAIKILDFNPKQVRQLN